MRLPNGYGSITKLSGKRRKPYMVRITRDSVYDEEIGDYRLERVVLGYYGNRKEAIEALAEYNKNPYDLSLGKITFGEIYKRWSKTKFPKLADSTISSYEAAYKHCVTIQNMKIRDIKTDTLQQVIDACPHSSSTKDNILIIMNAVFQYAMQNDLVQKNYASYITIEASDPIYERKPYTDREIDILWKNSADRYDVQIVLILLYTGMRVNELLKMPRNCCHLEEKYLEILKAKNKSSIRKVPIHDKIYEFVKHFYDQKGETLIVNDRGKTVIYGNFANREYKRLNKEFNMPHRCHDTRHTFISKGHQYRLDEYCLKKIVGHKAKDITQKVYTHVDVPELLQEINKIK